jgi:hypothetical protein
VFDGVHEDLFDGLTVARVAQQDGHVGPEAQCGAYRLGGVGACVVEAVDGHDERKSGTFEVVDGGEARVQPTGVDQFTYRVTADKSGVYRATVSAGSYDATTSLFGYRV